MIELFKKNEERREKVVQDAWEKAKEEAKLMKKTRLLQHARILQQPPAEEYSAERLINTPTSPFTTNLGARMNFSALTNDETSTVSPSLPMSDRKPDINNAEQEEERKNYHSEGGGRYLPMTESHSFVDSSADDRPIRPQTHDPLKAWDSLPPADHRNSRHQQNSKDDKDFEPNVRFLHKISSSQEDSIGTRSSNSPDDLKINDNISNSKQQYSKKVTPVRVSRQISATTYVLNKPEREMKKLSLNPCSVSEEEEK